MKKLILGLLAVGLFATSAFAQRPPSRIPRSPPSSSPPPPTQSPPPPQTQPPAIVGGPWEVFNAPQIWAEQRQDVYIQLDAQKQPYFNFNIAPAADQAHPIVRGVNYVTTSYVIPTGAKGLSVTYRIDTTGNPVFNWKTNIDNTCTGVSLKARVMIWSNAPDTSYTNRYWNYGAGMADITAGTVTLKADFSDLTKWVRADGTLASADPAAFNNTIRFANREGFGIGGGCFAAHGGNVLPNTGTARLTVTNFGTY